MQASVINLCLRTQGYAPTAEQRWVQPGGVFDDAASSARRAMQHACSPRVNPQVGTYSSQSWVRGAGKRVKAVQMHMRTHAVQYVRAPQGKALGSAMTGARLVQSPVHCTDSSC